jgi:hypothetical protein
MNIMKAKNNIKSLDQLIEEQFGKKGTRKRDDFENGYENFKLEAIPKNGTIFLYCIDRQNARK